MRSSLEKKKERFNVRLALNDALEPIYRSERKDNFRYKKKDFSIMARVYVYVYIHGLNVGTITGFGTVDAAITS